MFYLVRRCVVPENIHAHAEEGHWTFRVGGGGDLRSQTF